MVYYGSLNSLFQVWSEIPKNHNIMIRYCFSAEIREYLGEYQVSDITRDQRVPGIRYV